MFSSNVVINLDFIGDPHQYLDVALLWEVNKDKFFELTDEQGNVKGYMTLREMYEQCEDVPEELLESVRARQDTIDHFVEICQTDTNHPTMPFPIKVKDDLTVVDGKCRLVAAKVCRVNIVPFIPVFG